MMGVVFTEFTDLVEAPALTGQVLLASDDVGCQRQLPQLLHRAGLETDIVDNGRTAVEAALSKDYGLVLMDVQSPEVEGMAAIALLQAVGCYTPVVALAADGASPDAQRCLGLGCTDVLVMPAPPRRLYAAVARHLRMPAATLSADAVMLRQLQLLCADFRRGLPERLAEIETALQRGELKLLAHLVHTLKGSAGSYGHPEITQICTDIEAALHAGQCPDVRLGCAALRAAVEEAVRLPA